MIELFSSILPPDSILTSEEDKKFYGRDACKELVPNPSIILLPKTTKDVQKILEICSHQKLPVVPSGGRTGYSGGATATQGEIVVSLEKMNKTIEVNPTEFTLTCQAGTITKNVQEAAKKYNLLYPVDFASSGSSQIGGNIATNAGGIKVLRYGTTRAWVLGIKVVLANGKLLELNGKLIKNRTGYDLRELFIGSEGTLGIIVEATLKLTSRPNAQTVALCGIQGYTQALKVFAKLRNSPLVLSAFECFCNTSLDIVLNHHKLSSPFKNRYPLYILFEIEHTQNTPPAEFEEIALSLSEESLIEDIIFSQNSKQYADIWSFRENISEAISKSFIPHKNDISVPISDIPNFIEEFTTLMKTKYKLYQHAIFGHIGDGNLHLNILKPAEMDITQFKAECQKIDRDVYSLIKKFKGSISAEHGIGIMKKNWLSYSRSEEEIRIMKDIKKIFDPYCILNPNKIF